MLAEAQIHAMIFGLFASSLAPFGGFFASGFKRAFKIKDFGDTIPGHGGVTDRFDCQIMMVMFTFVYLSIVVFPMKQSIGSLWNQIVLLPTEDQQELM